jgi:hypothetical protein
MACPLHQKQCFGRAGIPNSTPVTTWQKVGIWDSHILVNLSRAEGERLLCGSSRTNSHACEAE